MPQSVASGAGAQDHGSVRGRHEASPGRGHLRVVPETPRPLIKIATDKPVTSFRSQHFQLRLDNQTWDRTILISEGLLPDIPVRHVWNFGISTGPLPHIVTDPEPPRIQLADRRIIDISRAKRSLKTVARKRQAALYGPSVTVAAGECPVPVNSDRGLVFALGPSDTPGTNERLRELSISVRRFGRSWISAGPLPDIVTHAESPRIQLADGRFLEFSRAQRSLKKIARQSQSALYGPSVTVAAGECPRPG